MTSNQPNNKQLLKTQLLRWKNDPCLFAAAMLGMNPTKQQEQLLKAFAVPGSKTAVKSGHGVGKSSGMAACAIWHTVFHSEAKAVATAPSANQLRDVLMAEISKMVSNSHPFIRESLECSNMRLCVRGRENLQFLTARTARPEDPSALQGIHSKNAAFFIDEAFGVADPIYEVARGAMSTESARVLLCGNPTATSGYAFDAFHRNKHLWNTFTFSCLDSPLVTKTYIDEMKEEYGEDSDVYKVRVLGQFPNASINQLIPRSLVVEAMNRKIGALQFSYAPVIIGVDPAWQGDDRSVVFLRQGLHSKKLGSWNKINQIDLAHLVNQFWNDYKADAVFIDVGMGAGVIDALRRLNRNPQPINFGSASLKEDYYLKRTEMWFDMKKWLEDGGVLENDEDLVDDLIGPEFHFMTNGKKMLEQKKSMKSRGLRSPDLGDALALTFAAPVYKRSTSSNDDRTKNKTDYDIYK